MPNFCSCQKSKRRRACREGKSRHCLALGRPLFTVQGSLLFSLKPGAAADNAWKALEAGHGSRVSLPIFVCS